MTSSLWTTKVAHLERGSSQWEEAAETIARRHYRGCMVPAIAFPEVWRFDHGGLIGAGYLVVSRPQSTESRGWYGSVQDVRDGRAEVTRWQVLNLSRVWLYPSYQQGGDLYGPDFLPGYVDRRGVWRSTLASDALRALCQVVGFEYLLARPPVYPDEPYEIRWLLSYCDSRLHKGAIYAAAGFELYHTNAEGMHTWRIRLPELSADQHAAVLTASQACERGRRFRAQREWREAQMVMAL